MKLFYSQHVAGLILAAGLLFSTTAVAQNKLELPRVSPEASVSQVVGLTEVSMIYHRPAVRGRVIWDGLVPYGKVWRTGANEATRITFSNDVKVNGTDIKAGTYALFTIPNANEWTVIFNQDHKQWGAYQYDAAKDVAKFQVKPQASPFTEYLTFHFEPKNQDSSDLVLQWEKVAVPLTISSDVMKQALTNAKEAMANLQEGDGMTAYQCANFCLNNNVNLEEALAWIDKSIAAQKGPFNLNVKARILAQLGNKKEAIATAEEAVLLAKEQGEENTEAASYIKQWKATAK